MIEWSINRRN